MPDLWLWLGTFMPHLMLIPILLPMTTGALMLLLKEEHQRSRNHAQHPLARVGWW